MMRLATLAFAAVTGILGQDIERYDLQKATGAASGNLIVVVRGRELSVSNKAIKVWPGWTRTRLAYTQPESVAVDQGIEAQALRIYDSPAAISRTLTIERAAITDFTPVLLDTGDTSFVLTMQDSKGVPWTAFANEKSGVYRREKYAAPGAIGKNMVEIRHFNPEDLSRANGEVSRIPPASVSTVRLVPADPSPVGSWVATLPAADAGRRKITLTLHPGGNAELETEYIGRGRAKRQGTWSQLESEIKVEFSIEEGSATPSPLQWGLKPAELVPITWNKSEYGEAGLALKRVSPNRIP